MSGSDSNAQGEAHRDLPAPAIPRRRHRARRPRRTRRALSHPASPPVATRGNASCSRTAGYAPTWPPTPLKRICDWAPDPNDAWATNTVVPRRRTPGRESRPGQPSGSSRPHDPARMRLPASGAGWMEPSRPGRRTGQADPHLGPRIAGRGQQATPGRSRYSSGDWLLRRRWQTGGRCCTLRGREPPPLRRSALRGCPVPRT